MIDLHAHVVLEATFGAAGPYGPELRSEPRPSFRVGEYVLEPAPYRDSVFMDVDRRLDAMDSLGIDLQMLSPNPLTFFGGVDPVHASAFARVANEAMAAVVAHESGRLIGSAQVALQDVGAACAEAERAAELGLRAIYIGTDYGQPFDSRNLDVFYRTLVDLDLPLFIHAATNNGLAGSTDERLRRFGFDLIVGYTYEETLTAATLLRGGVLDRHPDLDVCISHGGGAVAFLVERFDSMARFVGGSTGFVDLLRHLWFDAHLEPGPARDLVVEMVGTDRLVYGTNLGGWDTPSVTDAFDESLSPNARRLLRLEPSASMVS